MILNQTEAAAYLRIGPATFREHVRPLIHYKMIGRTMLFHVKDLDAWQQED